jgi:chemosensory pili system protein ChpA (sensor histidine kinase/response regulator)
VVDDSITVRKVSERFLKRNGFDTLLAKDGVEALEVLEQHKPSLFLLDIEMPRMDGLELTKRIRQHPAHSKTPIIMITSRTSKIHKQAADEAGVNIFLGKPYQEAQLLSYIQNLLDKDAHQSG